MSDSTPVTGADQEILITRIFDAPREKVFRAWTDPDEVAAWYGPEHFDTPRERIRIDVCVGGRWELTMIQHGSGAEFAIGYDILELVEPELIVLRSDPMPEVGMHERSEEHTSELQSHSDLVCRLLLEKKKECALSATWRTAARGRSKRTTPMPATHSVTRT